MAASLWWDEDETNNKLRAENKLEDLLVFGYACKLFRDDNKARAIENGKLLIPWMGDEKLMIDRYDGRGHLYDLASHDADNIEDKDPKLTEEEQAVETACDEERYLELHTNLQETQLYEEEEWKRYYLSLQEGYQAVEFSYEQPAGGEEDGDQHQNITEIIQENEKPFVVAADLHVPPDMLTPTCSKENARIEKTASFISQHGIQMEIMLKTKQASNTQFDFLHFDHSLNPYYKHVVHMIKSGKYKPIQEEEDEEHKKEEDYLHPSLSSSSSSSQLNPQPPPPVSKPIELPKVCIHDTPYGALIQSIRRNTQTSASLTGGQIVPPPLPPYTSDLYGSPSSLSGDQICPPPPPVYISDPHAAGNPAPPGTELVTLPLASSVNGQLVAGNGLSGESWHGQLVSDAGLGSQDYSRQVHHSRGHSSSSDSSSSSSSSSSASSSSSSNSSRSSGTRRKLHHRNKPGPNKVEGPAPVLPPPPDMQAIIDRMAMYVVKNGVEFEMVVMNRNDQRFQFLHEHHEYFPYYTFIKDTYLQGLMKTTTEAERDEKLGNNSSNSQRSVSFSIKSRPREQENGQSSGKVRLFEYDSSDDGEGQADRETQVQSGTATPTPRDTQTPGLKPAAADEEFQKEMEEKLKDKLASAVKERISQSNKEKQLQMERKKKAAAFLTFLKSSLTVVPPYLGQDSSTTCDSKLHLSTTCDTQQEETAAAAASTTVPTFDSSNKSKTRLLLKKEKTSKSSKAKKRSHRSPTPPNAYSLHRRSPSRPSPFQRTDRPTFRERTPLWQRQHREIVTSHKRSRSRSLLRKDEKKKKHRLSKSKSPARRDRSKERSRRHSKEKSRQKSKEKKKKEKSRTKSKDEENSRHRQSRPDNGVEFQDKHRATAASLLAPSSSQESIPCQRHPHSESIDEQVAPSSRGSSHYNSPSTRPNSQSRGSTPSRVTTDTTSKDLMSKVRAMLKKSREQTISQEDT